MPAQEVWRGHASPHGVHLGSICKGTITRAQRLMALYEESHQQSACASSCAHLENFDAHLLQGCAILLSSEGQDFLVIQTVAVDLIKIVPKVGAHLVQRRAGQARRQAALGGAL